MAFTVPSGKAFPMILDLVRTFKGANQGSLIIAVDIQRFLPLDAFKDQMDAYMETTARMQPMPGYEKATLPGVLEALHEQEWRITGIPVDSAHRKELSVAAEEFGLSLPF